MDAVIFEVDAKKQLDDPPVQIDSPINVRIPLKFQRQIPVGQPVSIAVALTNGGSDVADFEHGIPFSEDVIVFTSNGDQVWRKLRGVQVGVGGRTRLEPGEQIRLETLWAQRDQDGFELPLGDYLVRGVVRIGDFVDGFYREMDLATEPYELIIQP